MQIFTGIEEIGQPHDYIHLSKLLFQLSIRFDPSRKGRPGKLMLPKNISQSIEFLDPVLHLFEDLRPRWTAHIARRFAQGNLRAYSLGGRLGAWYGALHTLCCKHDAFPIMWEIFSDTAFEYFDGVLRGQNQLKPSSGKVRMYLGLQEAARYIGMSVPLLLRAIELKQIDARISREGVNYRIKMFSRIEADRVRVRRMAWLTESQVAEQLSVADSIVRNLVRAEVLSYDRKWFSNVEKAGPIDSASVNILAERLSTFLVSREVQESLTMNELTARRTVDSKALITLYRAIFNGDVRPVAYDAAQGLAGFVFDAAEVKKYLGSVSLSNGLTITQVGVATGWKYECISNWITLNLLEGEHVTLQGRSSRIVTAGALASFRRRWIPISDIAASVGSKSSAITKLLRARGIVIHGQTNSANGSMRGGLLSIRDLVGIAGLSPANRNRDRVS